MQLLRLAKQNYKGAYLQYWSDYQQSRFYKFIQSNHFTIKKLNKIQ